MSEAGSDPSDLAAPAVTWDRPFPHHSTDPFVGKVTVHGLASDEVRSALHKHARRGRMEQAIRTALELARTDAEHEAMMWDRMRVIAAEDIGLADPQAPAVIYALWQSAEASPAGSYDRLVFAAQAAGYLAVTPKDPTPVEMMQLALHQDLAPEIPDEALCIHTRRGQEMGRTMGDWFVTGTVMEPERPRDVGWREQLAELYRELDPPLS